MEIEKKRKPDTDLASLIEKLNKTLESWRCDPDSRIENEDYSPGNRNFLEQKRRNKMRASYFDGVIRYCNMIMDELSKKNAASGKYLEERFQAPLARMRMEISERTRKGNATEVRQVRELDGIARELISYCEDIESHKKEAA